MRLLAKLVLVLAVAVISTVAVTPTDAFGQSFKRLVGKQCGQCGRLVSLQSRTGDRCPHCGAVWGFERERVIDHAHTSPQRPAQASTSRPQESPDEEATSPNGDYRAVRSAGGFVWIYDRQGHYRFQLPHSGSVRRELFAPDNSAVVCVDRRGSCSVYELPTGVLRFRLTREGARAAIFAPADDGRMPVMICRDKVVFFRSGLTGSPIDGRIASAMGFAEVVLTCDGQHRTLFTRQVNGPTGGWDVATGRRMAPTYGSSPSTMYAGGAGSGQQVAVNL